MEIVIGQRYLSEAEPELGLGIITKVESKSIVINFLGSNTERNYAIRTAPLKRVIFGITDEIVLRTHEKLVVNDVEMIEGLAFYHCSLKKICENEISDQLVMSRPEDKLLSGHVDSESLFRLRQTVIYEKNRLSKSAVRGLLGPRISLIPHQYFVAQSVASQTIPRVLLADEVGLGKTIEAGLIIHKLLTTERIKRVLILVPDSLVYQWFIEMLKKFNLHFTTLNQETHLEPNTNPFFDAECVIVNIGLLKGAALAFDMAKKVDWDLLVIDEAHQLKWSAEKISPEYQIAEELSKKSKGLILLTATPEQLGPEGHFARLKLIDPDRFFDYQKYIEESSHFKDVANKAQELLKKNSGVVDNEIKKLQEEHGTGRIFFRNTREKMAHEFSFFPHRKLNSYPLESKKTKFLSLEDEEVIGPSFDLKYEWLVAFLEKSLIERPKDKILLITKSKTKVLCLEKLLAERIIGLKQTSFHSGLSFIARDQKAQYFRDPDGAKMLLCTEVGSEGRNFEVAHDLILFDLPRNPELLEQRIGRLDRIGQTKDIQIHVPYILSSFEEILFNWFHQGLNAFNKNAKGAGVVYLELQSLLEEYLNDPEKCFKEVHILQQFIDTTKSHFLKVSNELENGRDILVELNSFNHEISKSIVGEISKIDQENNLENFMNEVFEALGVNIEELHQDIYFIQPSDNMFIPYFPGLESDGLRITFKRNVAISHDDLQFLTWDHPMVIEVMDLILSNHLGNSILMKRIETKEKAKTFIECFFKLEIVAPVNYMPERFVNLSTLRVLIDSSGNDFTEKFSKELIEQKITLADQDQVYKLKTLPKTEVSKVIKVAHEIAISKSKTLVEDAVGNMEKFLILERDRLIQLKKVNPNIRQSEIDAINQEIETLKNSFLNSEIVLDSIRMIL